MRNCGLASASIAGCSRDARRNGAVSGIPRPGSSASSAVAPLSGQGDVSDLLEVVASVLRIDPLVTQGEGDQVGTAGDVEFLDETGQPSLFDGVSAHNFACELIASVHDRTAVHLLL